MKGKKQKKKGLIRELIGFLKIAFHVNSVTGYLSIMIDVIKIALDGSQHTA